MKPNLQERVIQAAHNGNGYSSVITPPLRFVRAADYHDLINLYHLARVALSGQPYGKYERMIWATKEFAKTHDYVSATGAYKDLSAALEGY